MFFMFKKMFISLLILSSFCLRAVEKASHKIFPDILTEENRSKLEELVIENIEKMALC